MLSTATKTQAKKTYHGPRLSKFLPIFVAVIAVIELILFGAS